MSKTHQQIKVSRISFVLYEQFILFACLYFSTALSQDIINIKNKSDKYDE